MEGTHTVSALILACDDNPDILLALSLLLRGPGHRVKTVESPGAAREAVAATSYDLILTDMNFTRDTTSGEEGLGLISELRGGAPVIAMTAWGDIELTVQAMQCGAVDFVTKPFDNQHLLEKIEAHLQKRRAKDASLTWPAGCSGDCWPHHHRWWESRLTCGLNRQAKWAGTSTISLFCGRIGWRSCWRMS